MDRRMDEQTWMDEMLKRQERHQERLRSLQEQRVEEAAEDYVSDGVSSTRCSPSVGRSRICPLTNGTHDGIRAIGMAPAYPECYP